VERAIGARHAGMEILYAREEAPLGTGGALWAAMARTEGERVFALNGDTWLGLDLRAMALAAPEADLVFAVRPVEDRGRYGSVELRDGRLVGLREKGGAGPGLVNAGTYLLRRSLLERRPIAGAFSFEAEVLERPEGLDIRAFEVDGRFIDIGTPEDFARAQTALPEWVKALPSMSAPRAPS
jgi:D-glycero-alpha-D-manno-heptose 1-phosphate guanylyltransferase